MKKKIIMFLFLAAVVFILAGLLFYTQKGKVSFKVEEVLPSEPIFFIRLVDLAANAKDFQKTEFVAKLHDVDFLGTMKALGAKDSETAFYDMLGKQVLSAQNIDIFLKLFGREAAAAFYPPDPYADTDRTKAANSLLSNIFLVTRLDPEVQLIDSLIGMASRIRPEISQTSEDYQGEKIFRLSIEGVNFPIVYVRLGDLLVLGINDRAAKGAIDSIQKGAAPLAQDKIFSTMNEAGMEGAETVGFFNYELFARKMKDLLLALYDESGEKIDNDIQQKLAKGFKGAQGVKVVYLSGCYDQLIHGRIKIAYDLSKASDHIRNMSEKFQVENRSLPFVPKTAVLYSWNSFIGLKSYLTNFKNASQESSNDSSGNLGVRSFGFDVNEAVPLLTDEIGWYFLGIDLTGPVPLPKGVFIIGVTDMDQAKAFIQASVGKQGVWRFKSDMYKGQDIYYLESVPFFEGLKPAYCMMQNYILVATSRELIKQTIDMKERSEDSLISQKFFKERAQRRDKKGNSLLFGDISALADEMSHLLKWGNEWAAVQDARQQAFKAGAQKRLEEVEYSLAEKQGEFDSINAQLTAAREQKGTLAVLPEQIDEVAKELDRKRRFLENAQKAVNSAVEEEQELASVQTDETQMLTETGLKLLEELREDVRKKKAREQEIQNEVKELTLRHQQLSENGQKAQDLALQIMEYEKALEEKKKEMDSLGASRVELQQMLKEYDRANLPTAEHRDMLLKGLADPVLEALSRIQWFMFESGMSQEQIWSEFFIEVK
jgi:uncharacterized protein YoxC